MIISKIAFRNIFRHKRRSLLTGLMMAGGCALFAISFGMVDGSYSLLIDMFTRDHTGHIQIHKKGYLDKPSIYKIIKDPAKVEKSLEGIPAVESWSPRIYTPALAFAGIKTGGVEVMGIDPVLEAKTTRLKYKVKQGEFLSEEGTNNIIIGERLARVLKVGIGDEIALIGQGVDGSIANDLFTVTGLTGEKDSSYGGNICYIHINDARNFLSMRGGIHELAVVLTDEVKTLKTVPLIEKALNDNELDVEPWQVVEEQFYRAMQADIKGNWITMLIFMIIIAIGILNTVLMVILERTTEFGVMRAIGTRPSQIFRLIVLETMYLSILSIIAGTMVGIIANWLLSVYGITLSDPVDWGGFLFDTITSRVTLRSIINPIIMVVITAILVSIPPAIRAARIQPVKALRSV